MADADGRWGLLSTSPCCARASLCLSLRSQALSLDLDHRQSRPSKRPRPATPSSPARLSHPPLPLVVIVSCVFTEEPGQEECFPSVQSCLCSIPLPIFRAFRFVLFSLHGLRLCGGRISLNLKDIRTSGPSTAQTPPVTSQQSRSRGLSCAIRLPPRAPVGVRDARCLAGSEILILIAAPPLRAGKSAAHLRVQGKEVQVQKLVPGYTPASGRCHAVEKLHDLVWKLLRRASMPANGGRRKEADPRHARGGRS